MNTHSNEAMLAYAANGAESLWRESDYINVPLPMANLLGLAEAVLLRKIDAWCITNEKNLHQTYCRHGHYWTCGSYEDWQQRLPCLGSTRTVQRLFLSLESKGYLISSVLGNSKSDRRKWYRVDRQKLGLLHLSQDIVPKWHDGQIPDSNQHKYTMPIWHGDDANLARWPRQNGTMVMPIWHDDDDKMARSLINKKDKQEIQTINQTLPPNPPQEGNECVGQENLTFPQTEEPRPGIESLSLVNLSNQPDSQLQSITPQEEHYSVASLVGNKAMKLESVGKNQIESLNGNKAMELGTVVKNQLERATQIAFKQNFDPARSQNDEAKSALATREPSTGDKYSAAAATETKISAPQANPPAVLSHQPELSYVEPNNFGPDEHDAVLPTRKIAAIETSPTTPNPSQHQAPARLQTELSFHPRSVANRVQETRFDRNQADLTKNLDGSDRLPWDTNKRGVFDQAFENHMARSLMQYPAYRELMAGELITKVRKHISAGRYDLKRRDELLIEWEAMQNPAHNDFSTESHTLTAKGAARRAKIARALNMKDYL